MNLRRSATVGQVDCERWPSELVDEYRDRFVPLVRLATAMLGSRADAEEVVQEVLIAAARRWSNIEHLRPYLRRAVVNGAVSVQRRRERAKRRPPDQPPPNTPSALVEFRDLLLALPIRQRTVLVLRYVEDLPDETIAAIISCRRATVRSLAARGLATIRKELG